MEELEKSIFDLLYLENRKINRLPYNFKQLSLKCRVSLNSMVSNLPQLLMELEGFQLLDRVLLMEGPQLGVLLLSQVTVTMQYELYNP